jgi:hypothetical protein
MLAVLDLGPRSMLTRLVPFLGPLVSVKNLSFTKRDSFSYFEYRVGSRTFYACPAGNLLVASTSERALAGSLALKGGSGSFAARADATLLKSLSSSGQGLRFLADSRSLLSVPLSFFKQGKPLLEAMSFPRECVADIGLSNQEARLDLDLSVQSALPELRRILSDKRPRSRLDDILPAQARFMVGFNLPDIESLFDLAGALDPGLKKTLDSASQASKLALGLDLQEFLYSWAGGEAGLIQMPSSGKPVVYLSIRNEKKRAAAFKKAFSSPLLAPQEAEYSGSVLTRIAFPWFMKAIFQMTKLEFDSPYLCAQGEYLFISQDPQGLSDCLKAMREGDLASSEKALWQGWDAQGLAYSYFDSQEKPFFLSGKDPVSAALAQYGKGFIQVIPSPRGLDLSLRTLPGDSAKPVSLAGFPYDLGYDISSYMLVRFADRANPLILASGHGGASIVDPAMPEKRIDIDSGGELAFAPGSKAFWILGPGGELDLRDSSGKAVSPFPVKLPGLEAPSAAALPAGLLFYSKEGNRLLLAGLDGGVSDWGPELEDPVLARIARSGKYLAFATKGFDSKLYLCDLGGNVMAGWPQEAGGIAYGSPAVSGGMDDPRIAFITQAGELRVWDLSGSLLPGFPATPGGVYYCSPAFLREGSSDILASVNSDGTVNLTAMDGSSRGSFAASSHREKSTSLSALDIDGDGSDELFLSGSGGMVSAFRLDGSAVPGFPLPGNLDIGLADIDNDGKIDFTSASRDGSVYAVAISRNQGMNP